MAIDTNADFTPTIPDSGVVPVKSPYNPTGSFKFWAQKVLPLVYDDSLSYYEVLCKVVNYLNNVIQNVDNLNDSVNSTNQSFETLKGYVNTTKDTLINTYNELQDYVNTYFDNLDVQQEINAKLDAMADSGELSNLLAPFIPDLVTKWLNNHVTPTSPIIDNTLTISGAGADAKVTGDKLRDSNTFHRNQVVYGENRYYHDETRLIKDKYIEPIEGRFDPNDGWCISDFIPVDPDTVYIMAYYSDGRYVVSNNNYYALYDANFKYIRSATVAERQSDTITTTAETAYVRNSQLAARFSTNTIFVEKSVFDLGVENFIPFSVKFINDNTAEDLSELQSDFSELQADTDDKITELKEDLSESEDELFSLAFKGISDFNPKWNSGEYDSSGNLVSSNQYFCTDKFELADIKGVTVTAPTAQYVYIYRWNIDGTFDRYITVPEATSVTITYDTSIYGAVAFETSKTQWQNVVFSGVKKVALLSDLYEETALPVPDYYASYMKTKTNGINGYLNVNANLDSFVFITDVHLPNNVMISPKLINYIFENTSVQKMICGGDIPGLYGNASTLAGVAKTYWNTYYKVCVRNNCNHYMVRGNHDWTVKTSASESTGYTAPESEVFNYSSRRQENKVVASNLRNYYYFDNLRQKIRYIILDTNEVLKSNDYTVPFNYAYGCLQEQVTWFINTLLNIPEGYTVMVVGHIPVDVSLSSEGTRNLQIISDVMKAYKNKRVFDGSTDPQTGQAYRVYYDGAVKYTLSGNADFTNANGELVGYICGHEHKDQNSVIDNVNFVVVGADALYNDDPNVTRTRGTVTESLFDVCVINKATRKFHCIRVGAGTTITLSY